MSDSNVTVDRQKAGRVVCTITYTDAQVQEAEEIVLQEKGKSLKVSGFRPGKIPASVVRENVGADDLLRGVVSELTPAIMEKILPEHSITPIARPKVEVKEESPLTVQLVLIERPETTVKNVKIPKDTGEIKVDEKDVQRVIDQTLKQHEEKSIVDRAAKEGDEVTVDFWGEDEDGQEINGTRMEKRGVVIGSKTLIPGFEDALKGMKYGDEKSFDLKFPDTYHAEELQGKPVTFHATAHQVEEIKTPEFNDVFVKEKLGGGSAKDYKKQVQESLEEQEKRMLAQKREQEVMEAIGKATKVELAEELVQDERDNMLKEFKGQLEQQGLELEQWFAATGKNPEEFLGEIEERAKQRLTVRFGLEKLIEEKEIDLTEDEIRDHLTKRMEQVPEQDRMQMLQVFQDPDYLTQFIWQGKVEKLVAEMLK